MAQLIKSAKLSEEDQIQISQVKSLKGKLLLFFDKIYPLYDFINWFEAD